MTKLLQIIATLTLSLMLMHAQAADFENIEYGLSDTIISTMITAKYTKDRNLNPLKISVSTQEGIVHLSGHVKNKLAFVEALRVAKNTRGVKEIDAEDLHIKKVNTAITDTYITAKAEAAVLKAKVLDDELIPLVGINATTNNGIVTLSGDVPSKHAIDSILKRVAQVHGVKKIISKLQVSKRDRL